jgi:hypothetical protein
VFSFAVFLRVEAFVGERFTDGGGGQTCVQSVIKSAERKFSRLHHSFYILSTLSREMTALSCGQYRPLLFFIFPL